MVARHHASRNALVFILLFMSGACVGRAQSIPFHELPLPKSTIPNDAIALFDNGILARTVDAYMQREGGRTFFYSYDNDRWRELPGLERSYRSLNDSLLFDQASVIRQLNDSLVWYASGTRHGKSNDVICWNIVSDSHYCTLRGSARLIHGDLRLVFDRSSGRVSTVGYDYDSDRLVEWSAGRGDTSSVERDLHTAYTFQQPMLIPRSDGMHWILDSRSDSTIWIAEVDVPINVDTLRIRRTVLPMDGKPKGMARAADGRGLLMRWSQYHRSPGFAFGYLDPSTLEWTISPTMSTDRRFEEVLHADEDHAEITYHTQHDSMASDGFYLSNGSVRALMGRFENRTTVRDWHRSVDGRLTAVTTDSLQTSTDGGRTWRKIAPPHTIDAILREVYATSDGTIIVACYEDIYFTYDPQQRTFRQIHGEFPVYYYGADDHFDIATNYSLPMQFEHREARFVAVSERYTYLADDRGLVCSERYKGFPYGMRVTPEHLYIEDGVCSRIWMPDVVRPSDLPSAPVMSLYVVLSNGAVWLGGPNDHQTFSIDGDLTHLAVVMASGYCSVVPVAIFAQEVRDSIFVLYDNAYPSARCIVASKQSIHALREVPARVFSPLYVVNAPKRGPDNTVFWLDRVVQDSYETFLRLLSSDFSTTITYSLPGLPVYYGRISTAEYDAVTRTYFAASDGRFFQSDVVSSVHAGLRADDHEEADLCVWYSLIGEEAYRCPHNEKEQAERSVLHSGLYVRQERSRNGAICRSECVLIRSER